VIRLEIPTCVIFCTLVKERAICRCASTVCTLTPFSIPFIHRGLRRRSKASISTCAPGSSGQYAGRSAFLKLLPESADPHLKRFSRSDGTLPPYNSVECDLYASCGLFPACPLAPASPWSPLGTIPRRASRGRPQAYAAGPSDGREGHLLLTHSVRLHPAVGPRPSLVSLVQGKRDARR
jgi:hypothetical protein